MPQSDTAYVTYQLVLRLSRSVTLTVGKLGTFKFPAGVYVYTGSAKRGMDNRLKRHRSTHKKLRWHIDYLLAVDACDIVEIRKFHQTECAISQATPGRIVAPGFGASDCGSGCGSHLKHLGTRQNEHTY